MKQLKFKRKLALNKRTISDLNPLHTVEQLNVKGGCLITSETAPPSGTLTITVDCSLSCFCSVYICDGGNGSNPCVE